MSASCSRRPIVVGVIVALIAYALRRRRS